MAHRHDPEERTDLVTSGLFAHVRNPIYVALVPTLLGLALLVPSVVALASVVLIFVAVEIETRLIEEPHLLRAHGDAYPRYAEKVGRFLPGVGRIHSAGGGTEPATRVARASGGIADPHEDARLHSR